MSLREEMWKYEQITGKSAKYVSVIELRAFLDGYEMGLKALEQQQKTGHWIEEILDYEMYFRCSNCDEPFWIENGTPKDQEYNFCPKCGARMTESEGEE